MIFEWLAHLAGLALMQKTSGPRHRLLLRVETHQRDENFSHQLRDAADRADLAVEIEEDAVTLRRRVPFEDFRNSKAFLEVRPDVRPEPVAAGEADLVLRLLRMRRAVQEVAAELADIEEYRAFVLCDVVPKLDAEKRSRAPRSRRPSRCPAEKPTGVWSGAGRHSAAPDD